MEQFTGAGASQGGADLIKNSATATFMEDVVDASHEVPVIVDFWAPWCGPCKQLGPILEKVVRDARGSVRMVKVNIDESPEIAQQMRIQSIPAVFAFKDGRPVDAFAGAVPESKVKEFVAKLGGPSGPSPIEEALLMAKEALGEGAVQEAAGIYGQILQHEPENVEALAGLAKCALETQEFDKARQILGQVPAAQANHADVVAVRASLDLAEAGAKAAGALGELKARLEKDPKDHQARIDLASALFASGDREGAIDELLTLVKNAREWNEQAGRKQLLKYFEAMGPADPLTLSSRRRLSSILFS